MRKGDRLRRATGELQRVLRKSLQSNSEQPRFMGVVTSYCRQGRGGGGQVNTYPKSGTGLPRPTKISQWGRFHGGLACGKRNRFAFGLTGGLGRCITRA